MGQVLERRGNRPDCFRLEGTAGQCRCVLGKKGGEEGQARGWAGPYCFGETLGLTSGSRRGSCPPGRLQGEEKASRGLSSTPGRSHFLPAVMTSAGLQAAARGWGWLPWLH